MSNTAMIHSRRIFSSALMAGWLVCLSAGLFFFYEFFQLNLFDVINQPLRDEFHVDAAMLSWMSSMYLWANILFLLPAGIMLDRYSTRRVILWAMAVCVFSTTAFSWTHSVLWACFYHFLSGIGNAFCFVACVVLVSRWFPPHRQAFVIGCLVTMAFLGGMMAHTPLAYLTEYFGWRKALLIDGGLGVVLLCCIAVFVKDSPDDLYCQNNQISRNTAASQQDMPSNENLSFKTVLLNRQNWLAGVYVCCLNLPIMVLAALWGMSYLHVVYAVDQITASNIVSLIFMGSVIGCPLFGWVSDRMKRRKPVMFVGALTTALMLLPLLMSIAMSAYWISVIFFLLGFCSSAQVIGYPLIAESNASHQTGTATGIASMIIMGGGGLGQVIFGWLVQYRATQTLEHYSAHHYQLAMMLFAVTTVISFLAVCGLRETYCRYEQGGI